MRGKPTRISKLNRVRPTMNLAGQYGQFPVVLSLEVVEHVYDPRRYAATVFSLLGPAALR